MQINNSSINIPTNAAAHLAANSGVNRNDKNATSSVKSGAAFDAARALENAKSNVTRNSAINPDEKSGNSPAQLPANSSAAKEQNSFELDENKLAIIEKHQASEQTLVNNNAQLASSSNSSASLSQYSQQNSQQGNQQSYKDQISSQNQTAVSAYSTVNNLAQRESVQKLFGVDLFA